MHPFRARELGFSREMVQELAAVKAVQLGVISLTGLQNEFSTYFAAFQDVAHDIDVRSFWLNRKHELPCFLLFSFVLV